MRAAVVRDFHRPIAIEDVPVPTIGRDEVLVRMLEQVADAFEDVLSGQARARLVFDLR
jgi:Zn-dependent alcohol dehydrogenase